MKKILLVILFIIFIVKLNYSTEPSVHRFGSGSGTASEISFDTTGCSYIKNTNVQDALFDLDTSMSGIVGGVASWGSITGTLSNQTDLYSSLNLKSDTSHNHTIYETTNHLHDSSTISNLLVGDFSSQNISQWTNDSNYETTNHKHLTFNSTVVFNSITSDSSSLTIYGSGAVLTTSHSKDFTYANETAGTNYNFQYLNLIGDYHWGNHVNIASDSDGSKSFVTGLHGTNNYGLYISTDDTNNTNTPINIYQSGTNGNVNQDIIRVNAAEKWTDSTNLGTFSGDFLHFRNAQKDKFRIGSDGHLLTYGENGVTNASFYNDDANTSTLFFSSNYPLVFWDYAGGTGLSQYKMASNNLTKYITFEIDTTSNPVISTTTNGLSINGVVTFNSTTTSTRFVSNVATGTAPYSATSTTLNTNLNSDLLDSNHGSYYETVNHNYYQSTLIAESPFQIQNNTASVIQASSTTKGYIDSTDFNQYESAFSWGNHASAGYLTGNQTITLSGDASGSGATAITVTVVDNSHNHDSGTVSNLIVGDFASPNISQWTNDANYSTVSVVQASYTASGISELATTAEINTGSDTTRTITPDNLSESYAGTKTIQTLVIDYTTNVSTGDGKSYFVIPSSIGGMNLIGVHARVITSGTTGTMDIQINNVTQAADMLSTKITIDSGETGSNTAATPAVIDTSNDDVATYDLIRIDIDAIQTTPAQGLIVYLEFRLP